MLTNIFVSVDQWCTVTGRPIASLLYVATANFCYFLTTREGAWYIFFEGVCMCVCVCLDVWNTITFESLDVGSSFSHIRYVSRGYGSRSHMKVIRSIYSHLKANIALMHPHPRGKESAWRKLASCLIYARALVEYVIFIVWVCSVSNMLPSVKFAEGKVLTFLILREKC